MEPRGVGDSALAVGSERHVLCLVRSGAATSRADLARVTGLAPSTISSRVDRLVASGILEEAGSGRSRGGRRPRVLQVRAGAGAVAAIDLGANHAEIALLDLTGRILTQEASVIDIADGPRAVLGAAIERIGALSSALADGQRILGYAIGVPGPVAADRGIVVSPSRMPGWNQVDVAGLAATLLPEPAPVVVDNDSNLMALGEYVARGGELANLIVLKAGTSIGCGVIASGRLYHGANGAAGDISHVRVTSGPDVLCSCGRIGCLDAVAGGAAIARQLRGEGIDVAGAADIVGRAQDADPRVSRALRHAGQMTGEVLATTVNFFNPHAVIVGGQLGLAEQFVTALRSALYELCFPMAINDLVIDSSVAGSAAGVLGGGTAVLDRLFAEAEVGETGWAGAVIR